EHHARLARGAARVPRHRVPRLPGRRGRLAGPAAQRGEEVAPVGTAGEVVGPEEILVLQGRLPEIDVVRVDLPHGVAALGEERAAPVEQEAIEDVHPAVLELHEVDAARGEEPPEAAQHLLLHALHVDLEEVDVADAQARRLLVAGRHARDDLAEGQRVRVAARRGEGRGRIVVTQLHLARGLPEAGRVAGYPRLARRVRGQRLECNRGHLEGVHRGRRAEARRGKAPFAHVGAHVDEDARGEGGERAQHAVLAVRYSVIVEISVPLEVAPGDCGELREDPVAAMARDEARDAARPGRHATSANGARTGLQDRTCDDTLMRVTSLVSPFTCSDQTASAPSSSRRPSSLSWKRTSVGAGKRYDSGCAKSLLATQVAMS